MERNEEMSVLHTEASAEATQDQKGNPTVVVKAAHRDGRSTWGNRVHLSEDAAQALLSDLLLVVEPAKPRQDVRVLFTDGRAEEFANVTVERIGDRYHFVREDRSHILVERRDVSFVEYSRHVAE